MLPHEMEAKPDMDNPQSDVNWVNSCLMLDEMTDNDDDWQAVQGTFTLPTKPVDLFALLGIDSRDASFVGTSDELDPQQTSTRNSYKKSDDQSLNHIDKLANVDVKHGKSPDSHSNGPMESTSRWRSSSVNSDDDSDEEKDEELLSVSREKGKRSLTYRGQEFIVTAPDDDDNDKQFDEVAAALPEELESHDSIFRVWDLQTPDLEDELTKRLKKALGDDYDDSLWDEESPSSALEEIDVSDIVAGLADLTLQLPD